MARTPLRTLLVLSLSLMSGLAVSQDSDSYDADPPDRAARLSYILGEVSLQPAGEQDWAPAIINRPLTTGDKLWTERNARAEINVGPADVRLDSDTGFSFLNVDDDTIQMRLTAGVINVNVRYLDGNEQLEIDTPNVAVTLLRAGTYRVEVNDAGDSTVVKVGEGAAEASGGSQDTVVHDQQSVTFRGMDDVVAQIEPLGAPDEFDDWTTDRSRRAALASSSRTSQYVDRDVTGYEDLDDNGTWSSEAEYGYVWSPSRVAADWSPYRYGRWVWVAPWGWTWIDDAPWGYAPFHYGRWAHIRNRWCWVPGPRHVRAVYAPALVGWVGTPGLSVSWFPLGPREVYMPWGRRHSHRYVERVNLSNTVVARRYVTDVFENRAHNVDYRNRRVPNAITAAARATFTSGGRIGERRMRLSEQDLARAQASAAPPQIAPVRESRMGAPLRGSARIPPRNVVDRQVVVRRDPPASAAHFARRAEVNREMAREQSPNAPRSHDRDLQEARQRQMEARDQRNGQANGRAEVVIRDRFGRTDRPPRAEGSTAPMQSPVYQSSVHDSRSIAERVREDRERQARETQARETQARENQQPRETRHDDRNGFDTWREQQRAARDNAERQERQVERREPPLRGRTETPQVDRPSIERRAERQIERPQPVERPQQREPRAERAERPQQSERSRPEPQQDQNDTRGPPTRGQNHSRPNRN